MLIVDDKQKEILEANGVNYADYLDPKDLYLSYLLNVTLEQAMRFNDADPDNAEEVQKYIVYVRDNKAVEKCVARLAKADHDILNIICDLVEGKHDEIMNKKED